MSNKEKQWVLTLKLGFHQQELTITGRSFEDLKSKAHKTLNEKELHFNPEALDNLIRRQNDYAHNNDGDTPKRTRLSIADAIRGATALIKYSTGKAASRSEIFRRSSICEGCPMLAATTDCLGCGGSAKLANLINSVRSARGKEINIPTSIKNKYCGACGCSLVLLVVTRFDQLNPESEGKQAERPDHCWLKKSSKNFTQE